MQAAPLSPASVVIDASVWVAFFLRMDSNHAASYSWIDQHTAKGGLAVAPAILLTEVAAAVSRKLGQTQTAIRAANTIEQGKGVSTDTKVKQIATRDRAPLWEAWPRWALANTIGGVVGWGATTLFALFSLGIGVAAAGTIVGFCLGTAQKRFFEQYIPSRDWSQWVKYTTVGGTIFWIIVISVRTLLVTLNLDFLLDPITPITAFSIGGFMFGLVQWLVLHRHIHKTAWWMLSNGIGWCIVALIGLRAGHEAHQAIVPGYRGSILFSINEGLHIFVAGAFGAVVFGILTGVTLMWLLWRFYAEHDANAY